MARPRKKVTAESADRVAALRTHVGETLVIRANPSEDEVLNFVKEHNRRYFSGELGGPSGIPAFQIHKADFFDSEHEIDDPNKGTEIDISSALPKVEFPTDN